MRRWLALFLLLSLAGCASVPGQSRPASTPRPATQDSATEVADGRINQLQRQSAMAEAEIKLLRRQLADLALEVARLSEGRGAAPVEPRIRTTPPPAPRIDAIESSDLEPVRIEIPPAEAPRQEAFVVPVEAPRQEAFVVPAEAPTSGARVANAAVPTSGQSIYDRGYTLYHQGRYIDAESAFQRFLQAYGGTELADNAQFWIGESRFARGDHMGALLAFQEVLDLYPGGNKVADSLLKVGDCLVRLDNLDGGRQRYQEVLRRFPGSAAAAMAEERLNLPAG